MNVPPASHRSLVKMKKHAKSKFSRSDTSSFLALARVSARVDLSLLGRRLVVVLLGIALHSLLAGSLRSSLLLAANALSTRSGRSRRISFLVASGSFALGGAASRSRRVSTGALGGGRQRSELLVVVLAGRGC